MDNIRSSSSHITEENPLLKKICPLHSSTQSADLAPVHTSAKYQTKMGEPERKLHSVDSGTLTNSLSTSLQEKLTISTKSKNCNKNGVNLRLGTTDVEVHCGPPSENDVNTLQEKSDLKINISQAKLNNVSSQENTMPSSFIGLNSDNKPSNKSNSNANSSSRPTINNFKPDSTIINSAYGVICNGHTVSEATSSNSLAISDFSLSSDKSTSLDSSSSYPGARPRTRNTSNSSSQSTQPQSESEADLSSTSEACKVISVEPNSSLLLIPASPCISIEELPVEYVNYENEYQMEAIMRLIQKDLSEPYSIYTYRYFIHNWPKLCFLAMINGEIIGAIVCKLDLHKKVTVRGYIAMLAVDHRYRKRRIGSNLVQRAIREMAADDADEVVLETEITNKPALKLYENLGFVRDKRLFRYYLNGVDALRLKLWLS